MRARPALAVLLVSTAVVLAACIPPTPPGDTTTTTTSTTTTTAHVATLQLVLSVDDPAPPFAGQVDLTMAAHNDGPAGATGVEVVLDIPAGLTIVGSPTGFDAPTATWPIGSLAAGADATSAITLRAGDVAWGPRTVEATVTSIDPVAASSAQVTITSTPAPLVPTITPDPANPPVVDISTGGTVSWTATALNGVDPSAPIGDHQFFWTCEGSGPCPEWDPWSPTLSFDVTTLAVDSYYITLTSVPGTSNYEAITTALTFTTTNSGGG